MIHSAPHFITRPTEPDHRPSLPVKLQEEIAALEDTQDKQQSDDDYDGMEQLFSDSFSSSQSPVSSITNEIGSPYPSKRTSGGLDRTSICLDDSDVDMDNYRSIGMESGEASSDDLSHQLEIDEQDELDGACSGIPNSSEAYSSPTEGTAQKATTEYEDIPIAQSKLFKRRRRNRTTDELDDGKSHPCDTGGWVYRPSKVPTTINFGGVKETGPDRQPKTHRMAKIDCFNSSSPQLDRVDVEHPIDPKKPTSSEQRITHTEDASGDDCLHPVQPQWDDGFDWFAFRAQKVEKVLIARSQSAAATRGGSELVYYSQSFFNMKKITACWMASVEKHKQFERQRELNPAKKRLPPERCVMYSLTERELAKIETTLRRRQRDAEEEVSLFDDSRVYQFDISLNRVRYLREPRPTVTIFPYGEALEIAALLLAEMAECIEMAAKDINACSPQIENVAEETTRDVLVQQTQRLAAKTIQTAFVRWSYETKRWKYRQGR